MSMEEDLASLPLADHSLLSTVELKNPFEYMVATDWNSMFNQNHENVSHHIPTMDIDRSALVTYDTDMSHYLHFDY